MKHYVIYSHGFGVDKTDRSLLSDIAAALPEAEHILFDYNEIDEINRTITVNPLDEQVRRLQAQLAKLDDSPSTVIDIVAHSQGCAVAALALADLKRNNVRRVLCLTPPDGLSAERMVKLFGSRPGCHIDLDGESTLQRRDGTKTIIPQSYWPSIKDVIAIEAYNRLPDLVERVIFYIASEDEILRQPNFSHADPRIELIHVDGDHNFKDQSRAVVTKIVADTLRA